MPRRTVSDHAGLFEKMFESSLDGVLLTRPDGTILRANASACRALGRTEEEVCRLGRRDLVVEDEGVRAMLAARETGGSVTGEITFRRPDGTRFPVEFTSARFSQDKSGPFAYVIFRDITERRRMEEDLKRTNRALRLLSSCTEAVARATDEVTLFSDVCRNMQEVAGYRMCWVGLAQEDARKTVRPVAWSGAEDGYLATVDVVWADEPRGRGPTGSAIRTGRPVLGRSFLEDPALEPWRVEASSRGYRFSTALPLVQEGVRIGAITMYSSETEPFDDADLGILTQLARDLSHGVQALRRRAAHHAAEDALRAQEGLLEQSRQVARAVTDAVPEPLFLKDRQGRWLFANPATLKVVGKSLQEVLGKTDREIYSDPRIGDALEAIDTRIMESGVAESIEETVLSSQGPRVYLSSKAPFRDLDGKVIGLVGSARDITDRKRSEAEAASAASRLQVLADASRVFAAAELDVRAVLEQVARQLADTIADTSQVRLFSDEGEWLELAAFSGSVPGEPESPRAGEGRRTRPARSVEVSPHLPLADEPVRYAAISPEELELLRRRFPLLEGYTPHSALVVPLRVKGQVIGGLALTRCSSQRPPFTYQDLRLAQDLADRAALAISSARLFEQVQRELAERKRADAERERLAMAIEHAAETVMVTDVAGRIVYVNPAFTATTGYAADEALGQNPRLLQSGLQSREFYQRLWKTITAGETWCGRLVNRRKDGTTYTEDATISPVRSGVGAITGFVAVKRDVSRDLALEAQLIQSQKMEGIGRLAGGVAHDFNNILSVILGCAGMALDALHEGDPLRGELVEVEKAAQRATVLTRQLLAFSRKQVIAPEVLDLNGVLIDLEKMLGRLLGEDIDLVLELAPGSGRVMADRGQLEQVVMNLAVNARDAMPQGGRLVVRTAHAQVDDELSSRLSGVSPGPHVVLGITDTGVGMDTATLERAFEPFFTTKGPGKGTGLGLSTVYGIVHQSGGAIEVLSEQGRGTTFRVYLPKAAQPIAGRAEAAPWVRDGGSETVLLVEDDPAVRSLAQRILTSGGYQVLAAANGPEALRTLAQASAPTHLVLTDVVMPEMSGKVLVDQLLPSHPGLKVLFMSGYTDDALGRQGILEPGTHFIAKPLTRVELLRKVRMVLDA